MPGDREVRNDVCRRAPQAETSQLPMPSANSKPGGYLARELLACGYRAGQDARDAAGARVGSVTLCMPCTYCFPRMSEATAAITERTAET